MHCNHCDSDPCHREAYEQMLRGEGDILDANLPPNTARRMLYRSYVRAVHGLLGHGNRVRVPPCVRVLIRDIFPDPNGAYMGHKDEPAPGGDDGGDGGAGGTSDDDE